MGKAHKSYNILNSISNLGLVKTKDITEQNNITIYGDLIFSFIALRALSTLQYIVALYKQLVSSTKFLENRNFFRKSINDSSFNLEQVTGKKICKHMITLFYLNPVKT